MILPTPSSSWVAAYTSEPGEVVAHLWAGRSLHYAAPPWLPGLLAAYVAHGRNGRAVSVLLKRHGRYLCSTEAPAPEVDIEAALRASLEVGR